MNLRTRTWFLVSLLFFLAAAIFWQLGERKHARDRAAREAARAATNGPAANSQTGAATAAPSTGSPSATNANPSAQVRKTAFPYRLTNTTMTVDQLSRTATGLILRNALIDSAQPLALTIPPHLRSAGEPGSYIVQSRGPVTDAFRSALQQAGAEIVSYVPNNAYLVRANEGVARQIGALPSAQAVLPWEPYYKIDAALLEVAVKETALPSNTRLNLLLFPGEREAVLRELARMEAVVLGEERSPFGWQLMVRPPETALVTLAKLPGVQAIERLLPRRIANDLARVRVQVTTNSLASTPNYLDLKGNGVKVNVNDTGVDWTHPDLQGRVTADFPSTFDDVDGHGTHVAGTIASSGNNSPAIPPRNVPGSATNANFRGMAPEAEIFAVPINRTFGPDTTDSYLQETAAAADALISNNSWGYFGSGTYTLAAASWDAAVRDALPGVTGPQPMIVVFSAGNRGAGGIDAPGTAKNVITVGAIENMRVLTNEVWRGADPNIVTNQPWLSMTDTNNEIAEFSSLGNVNPGEEGDGGRFKPDVVAPGTFVASTRSALWQESDRSVEVSSDQISFVRIRAGRTNLYSTFIPENGTQLQVVCVPNQDSPAGGLPPLPIQIRLGEEPTEADFVATNSATVSTAGLGPDTWFFSVANTNDADVYLHVRYFVTLTNDVGNEPEVFKKLNDELAPYYRYESGTSMSAPVVTGLIALMQEYFTRNLLWTNSPALTKALLINGARSVNSAYDFNTTNVVNGQGWGLANLTNSIPINSTSGGGDGIFTSASMVLYDQDPGRALATGQSFTRTVNVSGAGRSQPLRITLVWTDPPGNPAVGIKLVNNLDLVVTNLDTGEVYVGNGIGGGSIFNDPVGTGAVTFDTVNNVENVYLQGLFNRPLASAYSVTVIARAVNINAVTTHPDGVVQDYALVISSGNPRSTPAITVTDAPAPVINLAPLVQAVTNGIPLLNQRVGANAPYLVSTNGITNQWKFFVVTNIVPESEVDGAGLPGNYIAFRTFLPPNLGKARIAEADIDLYVSDDFNITNLDENVIAAARRGVGRGGSESIVLSNVASTAFFYAGVKSEDQQAANFGFFAISSSSPFSSKDTNGIVSMRGYPLNVEVPDGAPDNPKAGLVFAFNTEPIVIQNVVVTNTLTHEAGGDLFGVLEHDRKTSILNANRSFSGTAEFIYDDSGSGEFADDAVTDSPGTLRNFVGEEGVGGWQLTMVDSAPFYTGQVNRLDIRLEPRSEDLTNGVGVSVTIRPGRWWRSVVDVPADATNLLVCVSQEEGPVEVYLGRGYEPDRGNYDTFATIAPPGDCLSLGRRDAPPLSAGRYFIGVVNPNGFAVNARISAFIQRDLSARTALSYRAGGSTTIFDDATTNSVIRVNRPGLIADVNVGLRIEHPRVADLVMHLVSPSGTRVLLAENRGGPNAANYGLGILQTNVLPVTDSGSTQAATNVINTTEKEGVLDIDYDFFRNPDILRVYYEGALIFDSGRVSGSGRFSIEYGPGNSTNLVVTMNEQGNSAGNLWNYTVTVVSGYTYAIFTDDAKLAPVPIKFAVPPFTNFNAFVTNFVTNAVAVVDGFEDGLSGIQTYTNLQLIRGTGWRVAIQDVYVTSGGTNVAPWFILPDSGFRFLAFASTNTVLISTNIATTPGLRYRVSFACSVASGGNLSHVDGIATDTNGFATLGSLEVDTSQLTSGKWSRFYYDFVAIDTTASVHFSVGSGGSTGADNSFLLDSVRVDQVDDEVEAGIYFQPEEPMTIQPFGRLIGEQAFGDWTLEITDNRVGGGATNAALLGWKLNITYVNTNPPAVTLTNTMEFCSTLGSNETAYFVVDLPLTATAVTNVLVSSHNASLLYNATGLPEGQQPPDTFFQFDDLGGTSVLNGGGWFTLDRNDQLVAGDIEPQLRPGRRYYLAVRNEYPDTNAICIRVDFESANLPTIISLNAPNNCRSIVNTGQAVDYFSFDISTNAIGVEFAVGNIVNGDVDLYVRRGLPLPGTNFFSAASVTSDPAAGEFVQIADLTQTTLAGRWYAAVVVSSNAPDYEICAREIPGPVTPLTVNVTNALTTVSTGAVHYYKVVIPDDAFLADFQTMATAGNVDLYISTGALLPLGVTPTNAPFAGAGGSGNELIQLSVFDAVQLLTPGTWYLAVANRDTVSVDYSVVVRIQTTNINYISLSSGVPAAGTIAAVGAVDFYRFDVSPGALQAAFEIFGATNDVDLYVRTGFRLPPPGPLYFDFASVNSGTNSEWIALTADNPAALPAEGTYWIAVVPKVTAALPIDYQVRATEILSADVLRLFDGIVQCSAASPIDTNALNSGVQFFRFDVSSNAVQAGFEVTSASGDVDLYVQRGLPLTNFSLQLPGAFGSTFTNNPVAGLGLEGVCLLTNSAPISVAPGTYYLAVVNRETNDVSFCVRAYELLEDSIIAVSNRAAVTSAAPLPVGGIDYYRYTASTSALQVIVEVIQADANVELLVDESLCTGNLLNPASISTNAGTAAEMVILSPDSTPVPLVAGDWYIAVTNSDVVAADYTVRVTEITTADIVTLTNITPYVTDVPGAGSAGGVPVRYFVYNVSSNAARAQFEILATSDDVTLLATKDLPLPTFANSVLESSNFGTNQELIAITGSSIVTLTPGDWYLAVHNATTNDATFSIMASEFTDAGTNTVDGPPFVSSTQLCLSWQNAVPGVYYHVDGKASLSDTAWIPISPTILATNTTVEWCVSLPTSYNYFRFVEGLSPKTIAPPVSFTLTSFTPSGLTLEWTAPSGTRFVAEYTESLFPPNWQPYPDYLSSTNGAVTFTDDGSQTSPLGPTRYYRFIEVP